MQKTSFRFEAIVHDDASTDGTAVIIREYAQKYSDIIVPIIEEENQWSKDGESMKLFGEEPDMEVYETPSHNPGCLTMVMGDKIFTGDAYIPEFGVNTRLPRADKEQAKESLERIIKLAEGKTVLSGHQIERSNS